MIRVPKLSYNLQRTFSTRASLVGYFGIFSASVAAIIATLVTKGRVWSGELYYLSNFSDPRYKCNTTFVYPGQQFGGIAYNSSLSYVSQSSFAYAGQSFGPCSVQPGYGLQVIGPPEAWPAITFNYTVTCVIDKKSNATFSPTTLNHGSGIPGAGQAWVAIVGAMEIVNGTDCFGSEPVQAFRVDSAAGTLQLFSANNIGICTRNYSDPSYTYTALRNLSILIENLALSDFTSPTVHINPLPDVLYPCTKAEKIWAPTSTILLECYTTVAATFGPSLLIVTWLLRKMASVDQVSEEDKITHDLVHEENLSSRAYLPVNKHDSSQ